MLKYIVCYDIAHNRRRHRVSKLLEGYGNRIHESVFECELNARKLSIMRRTLKKHLCVINDKLRIYPLCERDRPDIVHFGLRVSLATRDAFIL